MTKERPILFSAPMVRAILAGTKTQTRRAIKPQPVAGARWSPIVIDGHGGWVDGHGTPLRCPYGQAGDRLWVRETFAIEHSVEPGQPLPHDDARPVQRRPADDHECAHPEWRQAHYRATDPAPELVYEEGPAGGREDEIGVRWKPSIHMPRWVSRILLEIVSVRVERLQAISADDAVDEGIERDRQPEDRVCLWRNYATGGTTVVQTFSFQTLWESINGPESWEANPWVWVVEFKRAA